MQLFCLIIAVVIEDIEVLLDETVMLSSALVSPKSPKSWVVLNCEPARMLGLSISIT